MLKGKMGSHPIARWLNAWRESRESEASRARTALVRSMETWPLEAIRAWQWARVQQLLRNAVSSVPYWRDVFAEMGTEPGEIRSWEDFARLPVTTKETLQREGHRMRAANIQATRNQTGGSTGQPLVFYHDDEYLGWAAASRMWGFGLCGFRGGERQVFLWGSDSDGKDRGTVRARIWDVLHNIRFVNTFQITRAELERLARSLTKWRPDFIWGYASSLDLLADELERQGLDLRPQAVQSTAGTLYPSLRNKLETAFGKVVFDRYGSREVSIVAHECAAHEGLHEFSPHNYVELLPGPGEYRQIVVTNLHNRAFPFIRYRIEDLATSGGEGCSCGRTFSRFERIIGRTVEIVSSPCGKLIDGEFFTHLFYEVEGIRHFRVIQRTQRNLHIAIVPGPAFREEDLGRIHRAILERGDPDFEVEFELVERIPPLPSGKRAFVLSKVPLESRP